MRDTQAHTPNMFTNACMGTAMTQVVTKWSVCMQSCQEIIILNRSCLLVDNRDDVKSTGKHR